MSKGQLCCPQHPPSPPSPLAGNSPGKGQPSTSSLRQMLPCSNHDCGLTRRYRATMGTGSSLRTGISFSLFPSNIWVQGRKHTLSELGRTWPDITWGPSMAQLGISWPTEPHCQSGIEHSIVRLMWPTAAQYPWTEHC